MNLYAINSKNKIVLGILFLLILVVILLNQSKNAKTEIISTDADFITYTDIDTLDKAADLIIIATASEKFEDREHRSTYYSDGELQDFYTLTNLEVSQVIKAPEGFDKDKLLTVVEPIGFFPGKNNNTKLTIENYTEISNEVSNIIFLKKNTFGQYGVINMDLGKFELQEDPNSSDKSSPDLSEKELFRTSVLNKYNLN